MEISLLSLTLILLAFAAGAGMAWLVARERLARLETTLAHERRDAAEKIRLLDAAQARLGDTFKALSSEALQGNNAAFLHLANATLERFQESARGDLERRQQAIGELVAPLRES
ncbi:MAG TPA: DNA recombination protein RmuC, partial [Thermoanaerobaculia bacterium]|nr:DNA recombination protein RmuC [Thermoanaerobaculia bacterium]